MLKGQPCLNCGSRNNRVQSTRTASNGFTTRVRKCPDCDHQAFTVEVPITRYQVTSDRHYYAKPEVIEQITDALKIPS